MKIFKRFYLNWNTWKEWCALEEAHSPLCWSIPAEGAVTCLICNALWSWPLRMVPLTSYLPYLLRSMVLLSTRVHFVMLYPLLWLDTKKSFLLCLLKVSQLMMHSPTLLVASLSSDIMNWETWLCVCYKKFVLMFVVSHTYSNYLGRYPAAALVSEVTMPDWTSVLVAFGVVDSNKHFATSGCLTQMLPWIVLMGTYRKHEQEKQQQYGERVWELEILILSSDFFSSDSMGAAASTVYKHLASLISDKWCQHYSITMGWLRTVLCFALLS